MTVLDRIAAGLSDDVLVTALNELSAKLDSIAAAKRDVMASELSRDRAVIAALRAEYRRRTGEVI